MLTARPCYFVGPTDCVTFAARTILILIIVFSTATVHAASSSLRPELEEFIEEMVAKHDFDHESLLKLFSQVQLQPSVIDAISRPPQSISWHEYRNNFVSLERIMDGLKFWGAYSDALERARQEYGVPEEIVVAVIGVETFYGRYTGAYRVIESLTTLALDSPKRAGYFRDELEQYLLLTREADADPLSFKGSYAGAMGIPQFMPSSYRLYAVDFDGDQVPDLWHNAEDSIGSVANYLKTFGWEQGMPAAMRAVVQGDSWRVALEDGIKPRRTVKELASLGISPEESTDEQVQAVLLQYDAQNGPEYWLGFNNFYVLTRYNRSAFYAMAVIQLAQEIRALYDSERQGKEGGDRFSG